MVALRALFWLALVSLYVPYKTFDPEAGKVEIDYPGLRARIAALTHPCETTPKACKAAQALLKRAEEEARALLKEWREEQKKRDK